MVLEATLLPVLPRNRLDTKGTYLNTPKSAQIELPPNVLSYQL